MRATAGMTTGNLRTDGKKKSGQFPGRAGYLRVTLSRGRRQKTVPVHVLVATAFLGPCPPGMERLHGPGGQGGNSAANLRYGTHAENERDKRRPRRQAAALSASLPR
jgi:hypothetical protein